LTFFTYLRNERRNAMGRGSEVGGKEVMEWKNENQSPKGKETNDHNDNEIDKPKEEGILKEMRRGECPPREERRNVAREGEEDLPRQTEDTSEPGHCPTRCHWSRIESPKPNTNQNSRSEEEAKLRSLSQQSH
jgi:hypothetical protein